MSTSRVDPSAAAAAAGSGSPTQQPVAGASHAQTAGRSNYKQGFRFIVARPQAIVIDLLGVLVSKSFMTSSKEFRDFFTNNIMDYLNDNWKQKQLKIMLNFFRCSQNNVPEEYRLADRDESKEDQIKQAKRHIIYRHRNDPTNSALSLFMLGITEWGYRNKTLTTPIYDEVPTILKAWREQSKIPVYVGVGSADFLIMVLTNTNHGNILPFFNGHMNIMDFDGTRANKDFKKLVTILRLPPEKILYLTRFRHDCRKAMENGLQSLIVLRQDFDSHGLISQLKVKRGNIMSMDGAKMSRGAYVDEPTSPPRLQGTDLRTPEMKKQYENNISALSLIDDHDNNADAHNQSSQIAEPDLARYSVVLSLSEIAFK